MSYPEGGVWWYNHYGTAKLTGRSTAQRPCIFLRPLIDGGQITGLAAGSRAGDSRWSSLCRFKSLIREVGPSDLVAPAKLTWDPLESLQEEKWFLGTRQSGCMLAERVYYFFLATHLMHIQVKLDCSQVGVIRASFGKC